MKIINKLADLTQYGIRSLTGEADALAFRALCDLTEEGRAIVQETYGVSAVAENWNSGAVASCMLPYSSWRELGIISLIRSGCLAVLETETALFGLERGETYDRGELDWETGAYIRKPSIDLGDGSQNWPTCYGKVIRVYALPNSAQPRVGTRNVHTLTGRVV